MTSIRDTATRVSWIAISRTNLPTFLPSRFFFFYLDDLTLIFHLHRYDSFFVSRSSILMILFPRKTNCSTFIRITSYSGRHAHTRRYVDPNEFWANPRDSDSLVFFFLFFFFFFKAYLITLSILCWLIIHRVRKYQEISSQKVKLDGFDQKLGSLSKDVIIGE